MRRTFKIGDVITLSKDAPRYILDKIKKYKDEYDCVLTQKTYNGYCIAIKSKDGRVLEQFSDVSTKAFNKTDTKSGIIRQIEQKQMELEKVSKKINDDIDNLKAQIQLMEELGVDEIKEEILIIARKVSTKMDLSLKDVYLSLM